MILSNLLTRFVICLRHGHEWRKAHRLDGTSYERCMGCDEVRS
jgi:hypothetical protein